jgi:hypothetical protein
VQGAMHQVRIQMAGRPGRDLYRLYTMGANAGASLSVSRSPSMTAMR